MRVTPPPGRPPNRASVLIREVSRANEIEITVGRSISLDFTEEGSENEPRFSRAARPPSGGEMDLSLTPDQVTFSATVRSCHNANLPRERKRTRSPDLPPAVQYDSLARGQPP